MNRVEIDPVWLMHVQKPARYVGGEWNSVMKNHADVDVKVALAFPDVYEVGMSHLGLKIIYSVINSRKDALAERVYTPWVDMEKMMRERIYLSMHWNPKRRLKTLTFLVLQCPMKCVTPTSSI